MVTFYHYFYLPKKATFSTSTRPTKEQVKVVINATLRALAVIELSNL